MLIITGGWWWFDSILRHFMLVFPFNLSHHLQVLLRYKIKYKLLNTFFAQIDKLIL